MSCRVCGRVHPNSGCRYRCLACGARVCFESIRFEDELPAPSPMQVLALLRRPNVGHLRAGLFCGPVLNEDGVVGGTGNDTGAATRGV